MRQVLIYILLKHPFAIGERDPVSGVPGFGLTWVLAFACVVWMAVNYVRNRAIFLAELRQSSLVWGGAILASIFVLPAVGLTKLPIFGYGMLVLIGFLCGLWLSRLRAKRIGLDPEILTDMSFWLLVTGATGGRVAHLVQYRVTHYAHCKTVLDSLIATVNLSEGGLVLIGALVGGAIGFFTFCGIRKLHALQLTDVVIPGVFFGVGFGRIGCLLNGCCYGDPCNLPWAIQFPRGSVPWLDFVKQGLLLPADNFTMPLHPTQIYSSIDGFMITTILWNLYPLRTRNGQLLGIACIMYACTRFLMEMIRNDTEQFRFWGLLLTISQWYSIGLFVTGTSLLVWLIFKGERATPNWTASNLPTP